MARGKAKNSAVSLTKKGKSKRLTKAKASKVADKTKIQPNTSTEPEETAYEHLLHKVNENERKAAQEVADEIELGNSKRNRTDATNMNTNSMEKVSFNEDDNYVVMEVSQSMERQEFPSEDEGGEDIESEVEEIEDGEVTEPESSNNNMSLERRLNDITMQGLPSATALPLKLPALLKPVPTTSDGGSSDHGKDPALGRTLAILQSFMIKKGLINETMSQDEMEAFLNEDDLPSNLASRSEPQQSPLQKVDQVAALQAKGKGKGKKSGKELLSQASGSEITVYKRAVHQLAPPGLEDKIDQFVSETRKSVEKNLTNANPDTSRKVSGSSDELMDISDETTDTNLSLLLAAETGPKDDNPAKSVDEHADEMVREAEQARVQMYEIEGNPEHNFLLHPNQVQNAVLIDNDYQMIDVHIEESMKKKILSFEYVDLSKLIKNKLRDDENRLEFVMRNGLTYLSPEGDREGRSNINSYIKWEQAFRVYCNVLTAKYPGKATELLQYNHTIYSVSTAYVWENVYTYDKEFCHHIGQHPYRSWNVILQQAWTMILKDRIRHDHSNAHRGSKQSKRDREPCERFSKGRCTFGLLCKFDHRCSVCKCSKFGHGAHQCRLRSDSDKSSPAKGP